MVHGLLAEGPGQVLWKEQVVAPEFLLDDREDIASNRNAFFYEDKRSFRPEGLGEQVKRIAGAEDVGLQPRLVTRVRLHNLREFLPLSDFFFASK